MTTAVVDDLTTRALAARVGALDDYALAVHGMQLEPYQLAWAEALETMDRVLIVCPPDTYKSTTVRLFVERKTGLDSESRTLWLMNSGEQAQKQVLTIKQTIESNPTYRRAFAVEPDARAQWTNNVLYVKRQLQAADPTLMATGLNGPYQGLHFDLIVVDDPTNQEDLRSPTEMEAQRQKVRGVLLDRLVEGGRIVAILTRWGEVDLVETFREMGFRIIEMPICGDYPWGSTLSPTRFSQRRIEELRREKGEALFQLTHMCNPLALTGGIIQRASIRYYDSIPAGALVYQGIDPAVSTKSAADYSAIATVAFDYRKRKLYLLDMWAERVEAPVLERKVVEMATRHHPRAVGLETAGYQLSLLQHLRLSARLPFREIPYRSRRAMTHRVVAIDRDKVGRAAWLASLFESGTLLLPRNLPLLDGVSLEAELCSFPRGKHDDRMDALAFACAVALGAVPPQVYYKIEAN